MMQKHTRRALKQKQEGKHTAANTHRQNPVYHEGPDYGRARCRGTTATEKSGKTEGERIMEI